MRVASKWSVVALGEMQQPNAVGGQELLEGPNPEGPNPEGTDFQDNAQNSPEQEVAMETWVNMAVDMLNRGAGEDEILARLAHDGCPDPQGVLQRAAQQPQNDTPISDEIGQDPFDAPQPDDSEGTMEDVHRQPPVVTGKVRIVGTDLLGVELERYEDTWGRGTVRVALDDGDTLNVDADRIETADASAAARPITSIQTFIDSLPAVEPTRPHIRARIENLRQVRIACLHARKESSFSDQIELDRISLASGDEILTLKEALRNVDPEGADAYLKSLPQYSVNALKLVEAETVTDPAFTARLQEKANIFVSELPEQMLDDAAGVAYAAAHYATEHNAGESTPHFINAVETSRLARVAETPAVVKTAMTTTEDRDGPAEALFL